MLRRLLFFIDAFNLGMNLALHPVLSLSRQVALITNKMKISTRSNWTKIFESPRLRRNLLPLFLGIFIPYSNIYVHGNFHNEATWETKMLFARRAALILIILCLFNDSILQWIGTQRIKHQIVRWFLLQMVGIMLLMLLTTQSIPPFNSPNFKFAPFYALYYRMCFAGCSILLIQYFGIFYVEHEREKIQSIQLQRDRLQLQVELVRRQVNPHFLFNSLSILQLMIREKDEQAEAYLLGMANVYKQAFYLKDKDLIYFQEEIDGLNLYLTMLRSRFSEGLIVMMDLAPVEPITKYRIPAMSLQILVENCIKHNIATPEYPLHIQISQKTATSITVSNNLQHIPYHQDSANIGHQYLETQYQAVGIQDGMFIEVRNLVYTVTLKLIP
jgi:hypothetical protein